MVFTLLLLLLLLLLFPELGFDEVQLLTVTPNSSVEPPKLTFEEVPDPPDTVNVPEP